MTMALPDNILVRILESLYVDFLESDESDMSKHHCSLLYPCISISESATFKPIYTFRLISSNWNTVFLSTARLGRYDSYNLHRKSVVFRRYRLFHDLDTEHGTSPIAFFLSTFLQLTITTNTRRSRCTSLRGIWFWRHWWMQRIQRGDYQSLEGLLWWWVSNGKKSVQDSIGVADEGMSFSHWN